MFFFTHAYHQHLRSLKKRWMPNPPFNKETPVKLAQYLVERSRFPWFTNLWARLKAWMKRGP